jgi:peptide chain release factor subunit 1
MGKSIKVHEGVIRPSLVAELEAFRPPEGDGRVSSYYLNLDPRPHGNAESARAALKETLARARKQIDQREARHAVRQALHRDLELVEELAPTVIGERYTRGLACFVASESRYAEVLRLPWLVRDRAFFEDRFVLWPLQELLQQSDRYAILLTDKDDARLFLFFLEQIEELTTIKDEIPGRIRYPDRTREMEYRRKHVESYHDHFDRVAETALRLFEREPFQHLIIGGLWEVLPAFERRLHRYLRDRIIARWDIDAQHTPTPVFAERARHEEQQFLKRQAEEIWKAIQDFRAKRGALGPVEVFEALWERRVGSLLAEPNVSRPGFRCTSCNRLHLGDGPCSACGGKKDEVRNILDEAVQDAIEQGSQVRYWDDPALNQVGSLSAFKR